MPSTTNLDDFLGAQPPTKWRRRATLGGVLVGIVLLALLLVRLFSGDAAPRYATQIAEKGNLRVTVSATGKLAPTNQVTVGSQLSGLVTRVVADVNDRVTAGQALALIDPEQIDAQIRQSQAQLAANTAAVGQAQATLAESQAQLARLEEVARLSGGRVPSKTELQTGRANAARAAAALRVAEANVVAARASLSQSQTQRDRAIIRSPVNGVVLARQIDPGQTVAASFNTPTLFVIAEDLTTMELEVAVDEADVGQVKEGQTAAFTVDAFPGKTFPARIRRVDLGSNLSASSASSSSSSTSSSTTSSQVVSYAATLSVANRDLQLRPGMTATAEIVTTEKRDVLLVPNAALRFTPMKADSSTAASDSSIASALVPRGPRRGGGGASRTATMQRGAQQTVYVLGDDGQPQAVRVTTGDTNGSMTEVTGGDLKPGAKIVTGQLSSTASGSARRGGGSGSGGGARGQ